MEVFLLECSVKGQFQENVTLHQTVFRLYDKTRVSVKATPSQMDNFEVPFKRG